MPNSKILPTHFCLNSVNMNAVKLRCFPIQTLLPHTGLNRNFNKYLPLKTFRIPDAAARFYERCVFKGIYLMSIWDRIGQITKKTVRQAISPDLSEMVRRHGEPLASTGKSRRENENKFRKARIRAAVGDQTEQKTLLLNSRFDSAWSKLSGAINYAKYFYNLGVCAVRKIKKSFALLWSQRLHAGDCFPADSGTTATPETNSKYGILLSYLMTF